MLGFKYMLGGFTTPTDADLQKVKFRAEQKTENDVKAGAIRIASDIIFGIRTYWMVRGIWTAHIGLMSHEAINWALQSLQWLPAPTTRSQTQ